MCFEYWIGLVLFALAIIGFCLFISKSLKTDIKLIRAETELEKAKAENVALKEVIRKQQIIINANEQ